MAWDAHAVGGNSEMLAGRRGVAGPEPRSAMDTDRTTGGAERPEDADDDLGIIRRLERERSWILPLARGLAVDSEAAEDLVQEAFIAALRAPPRDLASLRPWLRGVLRNLSRAGARRDRRRERREERAARPEGRDEDPTAAIERLELRQQLIAALLALDEPFRSAVVLRHVEEMPIAEIARRTGANESTVRTRIQRGLKRVRERLDRIHGGDRDRWLLLLVTAAAGSVASSSAHAVDDPRACGASGDTVAPSGRGPIPEVFALGTLSRCGVIALPAALIVAGVWLLGSNPRDSVDRSGRIAVSVGADRASPPAPSAAGEAHAVPDEDPTTHAPSPPPAESAFAIRVLDPDGEPAPGTVVAWLPESRVESLRQERDLPARHPPLAADLAWIHGERATTDADGVATCTIGEFPIVMAVRGCAGSWHHDPDEPENLKTEIVLMARPLVRLVDTAGAPIPGGWLGVSREGSRGFFGLRLADDEGIVDLSWSSAFYLSRPPRWSARPILHAGDRGTELPDERISVDLELPPADGSLVLRLSAEARERIRAEERSMWLDWWDAAAGRDPDSLSPRFRLGTLRFEPRDGEVVLPAVGDGLILRVRAPHCLTVERLGPTRGDRVEIALDPDPAIHEVLVPIVDEFGVPIALRGFAVHSRGDLRLREMGLTDERGVARFRLEREEIAGGHFLIVSRGPELARDPSRRALIRLPDDPPSRVELATVVLEDAPVILAGVLVDPSGRPGGGHEIKIRMKGASPTQASRETTTDESGRFEFRGEPPAGVVEVRAESDGLLLATARTSVGGADLVLIAERGFPKRIEGRLEVSPEDAPDWYMLRWSGPGGGRGRVQPDGSFELRVLHPEGDLIVLSMNGTEVLRRPAALPSGIERIDIGSIDLRAVADAAATWRELDVRTAEGQPHVGELEFVGRDPEGGSVRLVALETDSPGRYRFALLHHVELAAAKSGAWSADGASWTVFDPRGVDAIDLRHAIVAEIEVLDAGHAGFARGLAVGLVHPREGWLDDTRDAVRQQEVLPGEPLRLLVDHPGPYGLAWFEWRDGRWREFGRTRIEITAEREQRFAVRALGPR